VTIHQEERASWASVHGFVRPGFVGQAGINPITDQFVAIFIQFV
jgi:hypothetical protein